MFSVHFPSGNFSYEENKEKLCIRSALLPNKTSGEFGGFYQQTFSDFQIITLLTNRTM